MGEESVRSITMALVVYVLRLISFMLPVEPSFPRAEVGILRVSLEPG